MKSVRENWRKGWRCDSIYEWA